MASKLTSPLSKSPAYQLWTVSLLAMLLPPLIALALVDPAEFNIPAERLIFFCGFFVLQIEETNIFDKLTDLVGFTGTEVIGFTVLIGIVAMWFMILALPAFNRFSLKKRYRLHFFQLVYSIVQAAAGWWFVKFEL